MVGGGETGDFLKHFFMITEEEYKKAKAIVEEYELEEFETGHRIADEELNFMDYDDEEDEDEDDIIERLANDRFELALSCSCGAWTLSEDKTKVFHVADCICGAE